MLQVWDDARGRLTKLSRGAAKEAHRTSDRGAELARVSAHLLKRRADRVRADRVSWAVVAGAAGVGFVTAYALANSKRAGAVATNAMHSDWLEQLKAEHRRVDRLFKAILDTSDHQVAKRARLLQQLDIALTRHALEEENVVYPALRDSDHGANSTHLAAEHFDMKTYLHELDTCPKDDPKWIKKVRAFQALVREHVREEEEVILPAYQASLSPQQNQALTRRVHREAVKLG